MITFPEGALGQAPVRLPILARTTSFMALAKPAGVGVSADPCEPGVPVLLDALVSAVRAAKPQLIALGLGHVGRVHALDAEVTGAVVFAANREAESALRTAVGSRKWEFVYDLVAVQAPTEGPVKCELPIARHRTAPRMIVSHASGRKCTTHFAMKEAFGRYSLWEVRTRENRPHQVRLHAAESGLRIPGETAYGRVSPVFLSMIKPRYRQGREEERPLHGGIALHLREIVMKGGEGESCVVTAPRPRSLMALLKRLAQTG